MRKPPSISQRLHEIRDFCAPKIFEQIIANIMVARKIDSESVESIWNENFFHELEEVSTNAIDQIIDFYDLRDYKCEVKVDKGTPGNFHLKIWKKKILV